MDSEDFWTSFFFFFVKLQSVNFCGTKRFLRRFEREVRATKSNWKVLENQRSGDRLEIDRRVFQPLLWKIRCLVCRSDYAPWLEPWSGQSWSICYFVPRRLLRHVTIKREVNHDAIGSPVSFAYDLVSVERLEKGNGWNFWYCTTRKCLNHKRNPSRNSCVPTCPIAKRRNRKDIAARQGYLW